MVYESFVKKAIVTNFVGQRRLLHCKDPRKETKLTTKFQTRSPSPIGFVFRPGETYYYLCKILVFIIFLIDTTLNLFKAKFGN